MDRHLMFLVRQTERYGESCFKKKEKKMMNGGDEDENGNGNTDMDIDMDTDTNATTTRELTIEDVLQHHKYNQQEQPTTTATKTF